MGVLTARHQRLQQVHELRVGQVIAGRGELDYLDQGSCSGLGEEFSNKAGHGTSRSMGGIGLVKVKVQLLLRAEIHGDLERRGSSKLPSWQTGTREMAV